MRVIGSLLLIGLIVIMIASLFGAFAATIASGLVMTVAVGGPIAVAAGCLLVFIFLRSAMTPERRSSGWARVLTNVNTKYLFGLGIIVWAIYMASLHLVVPALTTPGGYGASANAEGGLAFIGLIAGILVFLGFIWAVIGE